MSENCQDSGLSAHQVNDMLALNEHTIHILQTQVQAMGESIQSYINESNIIQIFPLVKKFEASWEALLNIA